MGKFLGLRREDKNVWERRTPLIPQDIKYLRDRYGIKFVVQPSRIRIFRDEEYREAGALVQDDLSLCSAIFAIKEIPIEFFEANKTYIFFSHTIKGQPHNMPMLKRMIEMNCQLIDYERIVDESGKRLVFFGKYAGIAGMIDSLWALGERLKLEGIASPFKEIKQTVRYNNLEEAMEAVREVGKRIEREGVPDEIHPLICGITGYGNVSKGAQSVLDLLPLEELQPKELPILYKRKSLERRVVYKVVFKEEDMVEPASEEMSFDLKDYYTNPEKYRPVFERYVPFLTLLINAIYWDARYPRFFTKSFLRKLYSSGTPKLKVIGDISCDIEGSIEFLLKTTDPGNPVYVYEPLTEKIRDGFEGEGPVILAVDNLPCELPRESSEEFSKILRSFVPYIWEADFTKPFENLELPAPLKKAVILYKGELTPDYKYLQRYL